MPLTELTDWRSTSSHEAVERVMRMVEATMGQNVAALTRTALILEAGGFDTSALSAKIAHASIEARYLRAWLGDPQASLTGSPPVIH